MTSDLFGVSAVLAFTVTCSLEASGAGTEVQHQPGTEATNQAQGGSGPADPAGPNGTHLSAVPQNSGVRVNVMFLPQHVCLSV